MRVREDKHDPNATKVAFNVLSSIYNSILKEDLVNMCRDLDHSQFKDQT